MNPYIQFQPKNFVVHESVHYTGKPGTTGMKRAVLLYQDMIWRSGETLEGPPTQASIKHWVDTLTQLNYNGLLQLDIEHWDPYTNATQRQYLVDILKAFKPAGHTWKVGYYAIAPKRNHTHSLTPWSSVYQAWRDQNTAVQSIADEAEVLFPSLYTLYPDKDRWVRFAVEHILEARRYHPTKRICPIIWPQYHEAVSGARGLAYIDPEFWYEQLMTVYRYCSDVLIWKGAGQPEQWNETAPWLGVTREFIARYSNQIWEP